MTTYTVKFVRSTTGDPADWSNPAHWVGGVVANSPDADVGFEIATILSTGELVAGNVRIGAGKSYTIGSIYLPGNRLEVNGVLSVEDAVTMQEGSQILLAGSLSAGSLENRGSSLQGVGQLHIAGALVNHSGIHGTNMEVTAGSLANFGTITSSTGHTTVTVDAGGFANLSGSTLSGGLYGAFNGTLSFNVGGVVTDLAADVSLSLAGADLLFYDSNAGNYVSIQSSLQSIAASGTLKLTKSTFTADTLSIDGQILLEEKAILQAAHLSLGSRGRISGSGTIDAPIHNDGTITVDTKSSLVISGAVEGSGRLVVSGGALGAVPGQFAGSALELGGATAQAVVFSNAVGSVTIDDPAHFTGTITPGVARSGPGNQIILKGLSLAGLQGWSYSGDSSGGILSLRETSGHTTTLQMIGDFNVGSFQITAGPQPTLSIDPTSLIITVGGKVTLAHDTGSSTTDNITSDPTITQTASAGTQTGSAGTQTGSARFGLAVQLTIDGTPLANYIYADAQGTWSYTPTGLADGSHTIVARELMPALLPGPPWPPIGVHHHSNIVLTTASITFTLDTQLQAHADAYVVTPGHTIVTSGADGVLANDHTPAGSAGTAAILTGPAHGALALAADGSFTYAPDAGFAGIDSFSYSVTAENGAVDSAEVSLHVAPVNVGTTTTLGLTALTPTEQIAATYAAFFGRIPDLGGFSFWLDEFNANLATQGPASLFANIASSFGISDEAKDHYAFLTHPTRASDAEIGAFLASVYDNLFNRTPDAAGLGYWTGQIKQTLAAGQFVGSVLIDIMSGAQNSAEGQDIATLLSKVAVSVSYLNTEPSLIVPWADGGLSAQEVLEAVTNAAQTVLVGIVDAHTLALTGHL